MTSSRLSRTVQINLSHNQWEPIGFGLTPDADPYVQLIGPPLCINGSMLHVMAYQVVERDGVQEPAAEALREDYEIMQQLYSGHYDTVTLYEREYVLLIHPYNH